MKLHHFPLVLICTFFVLLLAACDSKTAYYTYASVPEAGWQKQDSLLFVLPDTLKPGNYELEVGVRHKGKYPYRDLWLEMTQYVPQQQEGVCVWMEKKDTFHIYLASEKGTWNGSGTTSGHFQLLEGCGTFTFPNTIDACSTKEMNKETKQVKYTTQGMTKTLGKESRYLLKVVHIMTDSVLYNVSDIGLHLMGPIEE